MSHQQLNQGDELPTFTQYWRYELTCAAMTCGVGQQFNPHFAHYDPFSFVFQFHQTHWLSLHPEISTDLLLPRGTWYITRYQWCRIIKETSCAIEFLKSRQFWFVLFLFLSLFRFPATEVLSKHKGCWYWDRIDCLPGFLPIFLSSLAKQLFSLNACISDSYVENACYCNDPLPSCAILSALNTKPHQTF